MNSLMMLAQSVATFQGGGMWTFGMLVLLIVFVTLVAGEGSKPKDQ